MMIDNDSPKALGFLQSYTKGLSRYEQEGEDIPDYSVQNQYAQELGGPLVQQTVARGLPVGEDPIFPMSQEEFSDYVYGRLDQKKGVKPQLPEEIKNRIRSARIKFGLV